MLLVGFQELVAWVFVGLLLLEAQIFIGIKKKKTITIFFVGLLILKA